MSDNYDEKKESIKKAALQVFIKYGYYKTTMDDIADGVGIKKNSLYYYFPNKESLFEEIVREQSQKMFKVVNEAVSEAKSVEEKIKVFFNEFHCYGRKTKKEFTVSLEKMIEFGQVIDEYFFEYSKIVRQMLKEILDEGCKSGQLRKINTDETAGILLNFISSYQRDVVRKNRAYETFDFKKMDSEINGLLNLIINGIK